MGALLQNRGLPAGMAPDVWMMENASVIENAHREYAEAGGLMTYGQTLGLLRTSSVPVDGRSTSSTSSGSP